MSKGPRRWPFPEDRAYNRAQKVALAYRNIAEEMAALLDQYRTATAIITNAVDEADKRLVAYRSPQAAADIEKALTMAKAALESTPAGNPVADLDRRFTSWGETWHCEQPTEYDDDDLVRTKEAAKLVGISTKYLSDCRNKGRIGAIFDPTTGATGGYWYKVADVYAFAAAMPSRAWRRSGHTDTLDANGTGDSE